MTRQEGIVLVGPSVAGLATRAAAVIARPGVHRDAPRRSRSYIRESILDPHAHLVPGETFSFGGRLLHACLRRGFSVPRKSISSWRIS
jgi:hypothetical protein